MQRARAHRHRGDRPHARRSAHADSRHDPSRHAVSRRGNPSAGIAHRPDGAGAVRTGEAQSGLHHAAVDSRHRPADRHGDGGGHGRVGQPLQGCPSFRQLVRADAARVQLRQQSRARPHLEEGDRIMRMLLTHGARAVLRAASMARQAGKTLDGLRGWELAVQERANRNKAACAVANKLARICYATLRDGEPYGTPSRPGPLAQPFRLRHCRLGLQGENLRCVPRPRACFEIDRPSWLNGSHPHVLRPITLPASFTSAACNDWPDVRRFHVGTDHCESTPDAGYTTACASSAILSINFLAFRGSPYRKVRRHSGGGIQSGCLAAKSRTSLCKGCRPLRTTACIPQKTARPLALHRTLCASATG